MLGMAYLGVPLYRMFCAATGYGGTVRRAGHGVGGTLEEKLSATRAKEEEEELERAAQNR